METDGLAVPGVRELKSVEDIVNWLRGCVTPLDMVDIREGRAKEMYHYLRHQYVTDTLNVITGHHWSNEVLREFEQENDVACLVRLTVHLPVGRKVNDDEYEIDHTIEVVHEAWGGATLSRYRDGDKEGQMVPGALADAYNTATSKGLTKAATRLGLGLDLGIPIRPATLKRLNTVGSGIFSKKWDEVRPQLVRAACHGRKIDRDDTKSPVTSSRDLREIEARILVGALSKDPAPLCQSLAMSLRSIAAAALQK